jgi:hypothetical protein
LTFNVSPESRLRPAFYGSKLFTISENRSSTKEEPKNINGASPFHETGGHKQEVIPWSK